MTCIPGAESRRTVSPVAFFPIVAALIAWQPSVGAAADNAEQSQSPEKPEQTINYADYFGFRPLEIFKLEHRSHSMLPGDFNSDGRNDLAVVDNSHSRIDLLIQRDEKPDPMQAIGSEDINRIDSHWRFDHQKLPVDREISAMMAGDFNGDGKADLAYFGEPDRLVVRYQTDGKQWDEKWETRLADVNASAWSIAAGDFNHDQRTDLAVLGKNATYLLLQEAEGGFDAPQSIRNTADELQLAMTGDFDGDGRDDLFYTATSDNDRRICVRLQTPQGRLGPEYRLDLKDPLGVTVHDCVGNGSKEILAIDSQTNRLGMYRARRPAASEELASRPIQFGVGAKAGGKRDLGVGDLDGDGRPDVVISDPETAQLIVYRQEESGLDLGAPYASFLGVEQLRVRDLTGDGRAEVVVLSPKEKTLGVCGMEEGRLTFPTALAVEDEVLAFELADLNSDSVTEIVYAVRHREGSTTKFLLRALTYPAAGEPRPYVFGEDQTEVAIDARDVGRLTALDANFDGRPDLLVTLDAGRAPTLFVTNERGVPVQVSGTGGVQLPEIEAGAVFSGELEEPALLISHGTFTRQMKLDADQRWQVLDQFNAIESNAKVAGAAALNIDDRPGAEIVLVDTGAGKLRYYRKEDSLYRPWKAIDLGTFPYQSLEVADLNGDDREDLLLFGGSRFAVIYTGQSDPQLEELAAYESLREDSFLVDLAAGDLNGDNHVDLAVLDNDSHTMELVTIMPGPEMHAAGNFKVFEEKSFHGDGGSGLEPREILIADVTGDGRSDLLLLTHDRILLYPQDSGASGDEGEDVAASAGGESSTTSSPARD
jgi:hypothetical protein